jgi:hypothetical protein
LLSAIGSSVGALVLSIGAIATANPATAAPKTVAVAASHAKSPPTGVAAERRAPVRAATVTTHPRVAAVHAPVIALFVATPAVVSSNGGSVSLVAVVHDATSCQLVSEQGPVELPASSKCATGASRTTVHLPANTTSTARTFRFDLSATGRRSTRRAVVSVQVRPRPHPLARTVAKAPTVTTDPQNSTVVVGAPARFVAAASGYPSPTVRWQVEPNASTRWSTVASAVSGTFVVRATTSAMNGERVRAVFTNSVGSATSKAATLRVTSSTSPPAVLPVITTQPAAVSTAPGQSVTFTAAASGTPTPTVQWDVSTDGANIWTAISGATSTSYSFVATASQSGDEFEAVFTNAAGSVSSAPAALTVNVDVAPAIATQPIAPTSPLTAGQSGSFTAVATGTPTPTVQWQDSTDQGQTWSPIVGATSTTYAFALTSDPTQASWSPWMQYTAIEFEAVFSNGVSPSATTVPVSLVIAPTSEASNWSGYVETGGTFAAVSGSWVVPSMTCSTNPFSGQRYSSEWVGIDGDANDFVEQDGIEADCLAGGEGPSYSAWYEMVGDPLENGGYSVTLSTPTEYLVAAGDTITASVSELGGQWTLTLSDSALIAADSWSWSYVADVPPGYDPPQSSAEWIVERPEVSDVLPPLAHFATPVAFTGASATLDGTPGPIGAPGAQDAAVTMVGDIYALATPSQLSGDSFSVTWEHSQ